MFKWIIKEIGYRAESSFYIFPNKYQDHVIIKIEQT